ncbi:hypothetical protein [Mariniflexile sp.]
MKKGTLTLGRFINYVILAVLVIFAVTSCREEKPKTETVIIEKQKEEGSDGTSLSVGKDGVEFSSKKGDKKTEVIIKD